MVAGTGGGDIEEAQSLEVVGVEQGVGVGPMRGVHQLLGERHGDAALLGEVDGHPAAHSLAAKVGEDANRELKALGGMEGEYSDYIRGQVKVAPRGPRQGSPPLRAVQVQAAVGIERHLVARVVVGHAARLVVHDKVDVRLPPEVNVLGEMLRHAFETEELKDGFELAALGRTELDEFHAIEAHGVAA